VEGGHIGERQHFTCTHVERDERAGLGPVLDNGAFQGAVREALDLAVEREGEISSILCRADRLDVLDHAPEPVFEDAPATRYSAERVLMGELDALLAGVVDASEAD